MHNTLDIVKRTLRSVLVSSVTFLGGIAAAMAQVPSTQPPYNVDLGGTGTAAGTPLIKLTAQTPATLNSAQLGNLDKVGALCTLYYSAISGSPQYVINIQNFDAASQQYYTVATVGSPSSLAAGSTVNLYARPGASASPATGTTGVGVSLSRYWRAQLVLSGANTTATGSLSCNQVK